MNTLEQLKTALGEPLKRKIGGQEFEFYPLDVTSLPDFFELYLKLGNEPEKEMFKRENAELFTKMIMKLLKNSFPKDTFSFLFLTACFVLRIFLTYKIY